MPERLSPPKRVKHYAESKVKSYEAHDTIDLNPRGLHPRTVIDIDRTSHFIVKKFGGFESELVGLVDLLYITRAHHTTLVCGFTKLTVEEGRYNYKVWAPNGFVGKIWGEDIDRFDLIIARLFHQDPEIERLTQSSGMDKSVEDLIRHAASPKLHN